MTAEIYSMKAYRPKRGHLPWPYRHLSNPAVMDACRAFDEWDDNHRRRNRLAGLKLFWVSGKSLYIACRHWPHLLCWQWLLRLDFAPFRPRFFEWRKSGPGAAGGLSWSLRLFWLVALNYQRQASDRIANLGRKYADAPRIFPREPDETLPANPVKEGE